MTEVQHPLINKPYAAFIIICGFGAGSLLIYLATFSSNDTGASAILFVVALAIIVGSTLSVFRASQLRVEESGISSGKKRIDWHEVTEATAVYYGLHLRAGKRKIVIAPYAYQDPERLSQFIQRSLRNAP
jgi:hypothetical protein